MKTYNATCNIFEHMGIAEQVYEGVTISKKTMWAYAKHVSHGRKQKGPETASRNNPKKGHTGKRNKNNAGYPNYRTTGGKACLLHVPGTLWKSKN